MRVLRKRNVKLAHVCDRDRAEQRAKVRISCVRAGFIVAIATRHAMVRGTKEGNKNMTVTIYHNPNCGTSRGALAILREKGSEPVIVQYLKTPLNQADLKALVGKLGVPVREVVRCWRRWRAIRS